MDKSRREFLRDAAGVLGMLAAPGQALLGLNSANAASLSAASTLLSAVDPADRTVVMVHLSGGNDGLNTLVPFKHELYSKLRPTLALSRDEMLTLNDEVALNKSMSGFKTLFDESKLAIFPAVGYPNQSRSHHRGSDIWYSAEPHSLSDKSWLPQSPSFSAELDDVLSQIESGVANGRRDFHHVVMDGFDTHANQKQIHTRLLGELSKELMEFQRRLEERKLDNRVITLVFSEFGRRVCENGARGTDHGGAGPVFVLGSSVKGGLYGAVPDLNDLDNGDLPVHTDFRSIYGGILTSWLNEHHDFTQCPDFIHKLVT